MFVPSLKSLLGVIGIAITTIIEMVTWWNSAVFFILWLLLVFQVSFYHSQLHEWVGEMVEKPRASE